MLKRSTIIGDTDTINKPKKLVINTWKSKPAPYLKQTVQSKPFLVDIGL